MTPEDRDQLAGQMIDVLGNDPAFLKNCTTDEVGELLDNYAKSTDPAQYDGDYGWKVWETNDWFRSLTHDEREGVHAALRERVAQDSDEPKMKKFIDSWKAMRIR